MAVNITRRAPILRRPAVTFKVESFPNFSCKQWVQVIPRLGAVHETNRYKSGAKNSGICDEFRHFTAAITAPLQFKGDELWWKPPFGKWITPKFSPSAVRSPASPPVLRGARRWEVAEPQIWTIPLLLCRRDYSHSASIHLSACHPLRPCLASSFSSVPGCF